MLFLLGIMSKEASRFKELDLLTLVNAKELLEAKLRILPLNIRVEYPQELLHGRRVYDDPVLQFPAWTFSSGSPINSTTRALKVSWKMKVVA